MGIALASPFVLFVLLAFVLYIPPVQNFVVKRVCASMSESLGMEVQVDYVRLAFPLDLVVEDLLVTQGRDTVCDAAHTHLDVALLPLFSGRADIDGFRLAEAKIDTRDLISDTRVSGRVRLLDAQLHGVEWGTQKVHVDAAILRDAELAVILTDTAAEDTTKSKPLWDITVDRAEISRTAVAVSMPGDSMRIAARLGRAKLKDGHFDLGKPFYAIRSLAVEDGGVTYDAGAQRRDDKAIAPSPSSLIAALKSPVLQRTKGSKLTLPKHQFDPNHIRVYGLSAIVDTLSYDADGRLRCGVRRFTASEQCGLAAIELDGSVYLDTLRFAVPALNLRTPHSRINAGIAMDWASLAPGGKGWMAVTVDASIGKSDIQALADGMVDKSVLEALPSGPLLLNGKFEGNLDNLTIHKAKAAYPHVCQAELKGVVRAPQYPSRSGRIKYDVRTYNIDFLRRLMPGNLAQSIDIPNAMSLAGSLLFRGDNYDVDAVLRTLGGQVRAKAKANLSHQSYKVDADAHCLAVGTFIRNKSMTPFTGRITLSGQSFDLMSKGTRLTLNSEIEQFAYDKYRLDGIKVDANLMNQRAVGNFDIDNGLFAGKGQFFADLRGHSERFPSLSKAIVATFSADFDQIDLLGLGVMKDTVTLGASFVADLHCAEDLSMISSRGGIENVRFVTPKRAVMAKDLHYGFLTDKDTTYATINSGDLNLAVSASCHLNGISQGAMKLVDVLTKQFDRREINQEELRRAMFPLDLRARVGRDNPLSNLLRLKGTSLESIDMSLHSDAQTGISGYAYVGPIVSGGLQIDTTNVVIAQDSTGIQFDADVRNYKPRNRNKFQAKAHISLRDEGLGADMLFMDAKGRTGINLGMRADILDEGINIHLYPHNPVIAFRNFTVNEDNFVYLGKNKEIRASVDLLADDGTGLKIYGEPHEDTGENDITLSIKHLNLGELSSVLPFMPQISGFLTGDTHITLGDNTMSAAVNAEAENFKYVDVELGNIGVEAFYLPKEGGEHFANMFVSTDGQEVATIEGSYFTGEDEHFVGSLSLDDFPLRMLGGFLSGTGVSLKGLANGSFDLQGTLDAPRLDGQLTMDNAHIYSGIYGIDLRLDEQPVKFSGSKVRFEDYKVYSSGTNPFVLNGVVNAAKLDRVTIDLAMNAQDFELVNTRQTKESVVYGKVYADYNGTVRGTLDELFVRGKLHILGGTNVSYIMKDTPISINNDLEGLVQFRDFSDTTKVEIVKEPTSTIDATLDVEVAETARVHCLLSPNAESYVNLEGGGNLTMRLTHQGDVRLTGRYTVAEGEMKYSLPVIPLRTFNLESGSYVDFTGEMMNPTLSIRAKERLKAVVTQDGQQRSVAFDVGISLTKPLADMGLEFTIEAPEDLEISNQLAAMSAEQRGQAAVAMMATGMYIGSGNEGSGFKASNALNAFLQGEIQKIAGKALKTIDISLGVESGTSKTGTNTTDYSFQFSKRFLNDRFSVIIGGVVSTGNNAYNSAESFINNVSLEYRLDKGASCNVRVFYDRSVVDPLEGQLMKTGAGLVLRRKTNHLGELFIFRRNKK